ncbi:MAG: hypothetical protein JNM25_07930 [Planctomycetes bacterium]|nr:hypothetical protein [Planctomycetota bacterium]
MTGRLQPPFDLDRFAAAGRATLKVEPQTTIERLGSGDDAVVCKTYHNRGRRWLQSFGRRSRARREFDNLRAGASTGAPCSQALAWSERRRWGCVDESVLVTRWVAASRPLKQVLADLPPAPHFATRRRLIAAMARLVATLHRGRFLWGTAMPRNVLVVGDPDLARLVVCDVPAGIRLHVPLHGGRLALFDLFDGAFSPSRRADFAATERLRWLCAYTDGDRAAARRLWRTLDRRSVLRHDVGRALAMFWHVYIVQPLRRRLSPPARPER